jgi:hypothetical protein
MTVYDIAPQTRRSERRQALEIAVQRVLDMPNLDERLIYRATQQLIIENDPAYWIRRAEEFEAAAPRPGQYLGQATPAELSERWHDCIATAVACRRHAQLLSGQEIAP